MLSTLDELDEFFETLIEERSHSWILHYNFLLNSPFIDEWEKKSLEDLIRFNKCFDV